MVGSIREILKIETPEELQTAFGKLEQDLTERLKYVEQALDKNILSTDVQDIQQHMSYVESWRNKVGRYLYLVDGFVAYAKSSQFALPVEKGNTEAVRDAYKKLLAGPYEAMQRWLENLLDSIDSRVNLCKKKLGLEGSVEGVRANTRAA